MAMDESFVRWALCQSGGDRKFNVAESAYEELALHVELRLRRVLRLAWRLCLHARRRRLERSDVEDVILINGIFPGGPMRLAPIFALASAAATARGAPGHDRLVSISAELQKSSHQIKRREEKPSPCLSTVALMETGEFKVPRLEEDLPWTLPEPGSPRPSAREMTTEMRQRLLRTVQVLEGGMATRPQHAATLADVASDSFAPLAPHLAEFLAHHVPQRVAAAATPSELLLLLRILEAITVSPHVNSTGYLHLCLVPALVLCLKSRSEPSDGAELEQGESMQEVAADSISRTAAGFLASMVRNNAIRLPELGMEALRLLRAVLSRRPPLRTAAGAAFCLARLGPRAVEEVLCPALRPDAAFACYLAQLQGSPRSALLLAALAEALRRAALEGGDIAILSAACDHAVRALGGAGDLAWMSLGLGMQVESVTAAEGGLPAKRRKLQATPLGDGRINDEVLEGLRSQRLPATSFSPPARREELLARLRPHF
ncbi:unnamed protein product [Symbiodinium sp. CCMP2592]|nr:unnamed protein product [Symbiodinium sp. CCMP2592]